MEINSFLKSRRMILILLVALVLVTMTTVPTMALDDGHSYDMTWRGATDEVNNALISAFTPTDSTGTGYWHSFLRVSSNMSVVKGYNSDYKSNTNVEFEEDFSWTSSFLLIDVPQVKVENTLYREFQLDINQNSKNTEALISIDNIEVYLTNILMNDDLLPLIKYPFNDDPMEFVWGLDEGGVDNVILLNFNLNPGSGKRDFKIQIPDELFNAGYKYVVLYAEHGGDTYSGSYDLDADPATTGDVSSVTNAIFGNNDGFEEWGVTKYPATKTGHKFKDLNADGVWDTDEPGFPGWTIFVDYDGNGVLDAGEPFDVTDENGEYEITGIEPGIYNVREVMQEGWVCTWPNEDGCYYNEEFGNGAWVTGNDFGNTPSETETTTLLYKVVGTVGGGDDISLPPESNEIIEGGYVYDTAVVSSPIGTPTGKVQFKYLAPGGTWTNLGDEVTLSGGIATSEAIQVNIPGNWYFQACYLGDGLYPTSESGLEDEPLVVLNEELTVSKTVDTSYTRTHKWLIDKWVETDNGDTIGELNIPKIWLLEGSNESENAYWYVDVDYNGYDDSAHSVSGTITITNTGTQDAVINSVSDVLGGTTITADFGAAVFPYTLPVGATLEGTYSESGEFKGNNVVTVTTEIDTYSDTKPIVWGDPVSEINETVNITDLSDIFGSVDLGSVIAPNGYTFDYSKEFKWSDYTGEQHLTFNNTATIDETGQNDSAILKVNKLDEELSVSKTVNTSYTRTHKWLIDKYVTTENGYTIGEEEIPKIWLYTDGSGDETATWYVDVDYDGFIDSGFAISGTITIENTGTQDAMIISLEDVLAGTTVPVTWTWPEGTTLPYLLKVGETLTGTYVGNISDYVDGKNVIYVSTDVDDYTGDADIEWGDPDEVINETVHIRDISDLFGTVDLGTVTAPTGDQFTYENEFTYAGYLNKGEHQIYNNTATIVETGQSDSAVLKVNVQQYNYETAWRFGNIEHMSIIDTNNWGWSDGPLAQSGTAYREFLYAGAGGNSTTKGAIVGYVDVLYWNDKVTVTYSCDSGFFLKEVHLWVGDNELPTKGKSMTNAPGQFTWPNKKTPGEWIGTKGAYSGWTITLEDFKTENGNIYVAAHSVVGIPDPNFGPIN